MKLKTPCVSKGSLLLIVLEQSPLRHLEKSISAATIPLRDIHPDIAIGLVAVIIQREMPGLDAAGEHFAGANIQGIPISTIVGSYNVPVHRIPILRVVAGCESIGVDHLRRRELFLEPEWLGEIEGQVFGTEITVYQMGRTFG